MNSDERDFLLRIYDASSDDNLWPGLLHEFAERIGAIGCIVFEWKTGERGRYLEAPIISSFYDPVAVRTYLDKCFEFEARDQDIFESHSLRADGVDLIEDDILAPTLEDLKRRPNVEILQKLGILHRTAGLLNKDNTRVSRFSIQMAKDRGRLTMREKKLMRDFLPHIAKAMDLGRPAKELAQHNMGLISALDRLSIGVCLLDKNAQIVEANAEFRRQQEEYNVFMTTNRGELRFVKENPQGDLAFLMADPFNHGRFGARPRKEAFAVGEDQFLCVELVPFTNSKEIGENSFGGYILYSRDTSRPLFCDVDPMKEAFGLTDREMDVVKMVGDGLTISEMAERSQRAASTVNSHVKSILSKSNCSSRTQFVRMMSSFDAPFVADEKKSETVSGTGHSRGDSLS